MYYGNNKNAFCVHFFASENNAFNLQYDGKVD